MKYIRKFTEELEKSIKDHCYDLWLSSNYIINDDDTVDVGGSVFISHKNLERIPIQFKTVGDIFDCSHNILISLKGSPKKVEGTFNCTHNLLISLEGGPKEIGRDYICYLNELISLEGCADIIGGELMCSHNPIWEIVRLFGDYKRYKDSLDYNYLRGNSIIKLRFHEALEEIGIIELPDSIPGYKYI